MNTAEQIFDAFGRLLDAVCRADAIRKKQAQIRSVQERRCGNCQHWMTSDCAPEKEHGQFKSCNSLACELFELGGSSKRLADEFSQELEVLANTPPGDKP